MPRNRGIGRKYKKSRLTVTEEPTPEVEEQLEEDVEEEEPELDDEVIEVIEEATSTVMDTVIEKLWCRDSTGWFLPVMSQKRHMLSLFSGLTLFLAFAFHLAALAGPEAGLAVWVFLRAN